MTFIIFIDYTDDKVDESGESGMPFKSHGKVAWSHVLCSEDGFILVHRKGGGNIGEDMSCFFLFWEKGGFGVFPVSVHGSVCNRIVIHLFMGCCEVDLNRESSKVNDLVN